MLWGRFLVLICVALYSHVNLIARIADLTEISLETIDFSQLKCVKKVVDDRPATAHIRSTYRTDDNSYYKIWTPDYKCSYNFIKALKAGFFDDLTSLVSIIYDSNHCCRGYVTKSGSSISPKKIQIDRYILNGNTVVAIASLRKQTDPDYIKFYAKLLNNTKQSKYAFVDFVPSNIVFIDGEYKLIDLESVEPLSFIRPYFFSSPYSPADYRDYIKGLCCSKSISGHFFSNTYSSADYRDYFEYVPADYMDYIKLVCCSSLMEVNQKFNPKKFVLLHYTV